ncbi:MAG: LuxR family transcriptional regulator [Betaproteobacteria bacterium]|jgi:LuxR family quorum-sensing system transcriptional regulator ExpR|nr:LuxR family transcriptional regulator [Betaproteobacteria bacterium]MDH5286243.1 LuxR family transcriptional regulator [Betaproteobacteria bacterium]
MLNRVDIKAHHVLAAERNPRLLQLLVDAADGGGDLVESVRATVARWGFDSFVCGLACMPAPTRAAQLYVFATLPDEWLRLYETNGYVEVDPRLALSHDRPTITPWSSGGFAGRGERIDAFLRDAARFGIRSGACFTLHNAYNDRVMIGFNSTRERTLPEDIEPHLGDLYSFGLHFQAVFMRAVIERGLPSRLRGARLTRRELEVLNYVAFGLTANDIAPKLSITPRTVRFHVDSVCSKMGVLNREEAIALAVKGGLINVVP